MVDVEIRRDEETRIGRGETRNAGGCGRARLSCKSDKRRPKNSKKRNVFSDLCVAFGWSAQMSEEALEARERGGVWGVERSECKKMM